MKPEAFQRVIELFRDACELRSERRGAFLDEACAADPELRREVESLLAAHEQAGSFLSTSAVEAGAGMVASAEARAMVGRQIGHFHVLSLLAKGGMGEVYLAKDVRLEREVALKFLPAEFTAEADRLRRFEQEARAASALNHPNIVTVHEIGESDNLHFIAAEHVQGRTLRDLLAAEEAEKPRKLDVRKALEIAIQVAGALKAAHTAWIIHRDIKPENIMVRPDGLVKVLDFGIAKLSEKIPAAEPGDSAPRLPEIAAEVAAPSSISDLTLPGTIMGTASYMSPEQARGEPLDGRTDLFSLGVVLFEMVTGERLFTGATRAEALQATQAPDEQLPPNVQIPKELERILRRMLRRNRAERYASAGELLDELSRLKRRIESRTVRGILGLSAMAVVLAVTLAAAAAFLSLSEVWEERVLRDGHTAAAVQAVFSPDGRLLVSCGEDGRVIVWDFARRQRFATLNHPAHKVAFSPDGRSFATGGTDGSIIIWDATRLEKTRVLREHSESIGGLSFSPNGRLLASCSTGLPQGRTVVWETSRWEKLRELPRGMAHGTFLFSPDERQLMTSMRFVYDLATGRQLMDDSQNSGGWAALSADASRAASVDSSGAVSFYRLSRRGDLSRQELIVRRRLHRDHGRAVAFSPDGRLAASAAEDIILWDAATQEKIARLEYSAIVWNIAFSPDGRWLVSTHGDGAVLVWNVAERERVANFNEHSAGVRAVAFGPDGRRIASASEDRAVIVWDTEHERKDAVLEQHQTRVMAVAFSADGSVFGSADQDGAVILWDMARRQPRLTIKPDRFSPSYCLAISSDGRWVATTHGVYAIADGRRVADLARLGELSGIYGAAFSADGRRLACVSAGGWVLLWDTESWLMIERRQIANTGLISVSYSPDGKGLVTGEDPGGVRLWSVEPLREIAVLGRHSARVKSVAFSPDGASVASAGDDKRIALWDVTKRKLISTIGTHVSPVYSIAFSPDGRQLVSGEHDRSVRLYTRHRTLWGFRLD